MKHKGRYFLKIYSAQYGLLLLFTFLFLFIPMTLYSSEVFYVQVGAFSSEKNAQNLIESLKTHGIKCTTYEAGNMYKVYCGEFSNQEAVSALKMKLYFLGYKQAIVVSQSNLPSQDTIKKDQDTIKKDNVAAQSLQQEVALSKENIQEKLQKQTEHADTVDLIETKEVKDIPVNIARDYLVGSQDVLKISVYEHPDLATTVRVSEDGRITFPLVGELDVKNLSVQQIEKKIASKLSDGLIPNPQVTVFIEQFKGTRVTVMGEVTKPGQYEITGPTSVVEAISMALGMTENSGYTIMLFKKDATTGKNPGYKRIAIDVDRLFKEGDLSQNVQLQNGDIIYVPKIDFFYIYGEVTRPGIYRIEKGLTVKRAISMAGGFTPKASKGRIEITRQQEGKDIVKKADIDESVKPDDTIMVKESIF
ncbi:MAG: SLBB domain-containing protein [Nitrospirota bacterium]